MSKHNAADKLKLELESETSQSHVPTRRISTYRILISHRYVRTDEYQRLVRMLDNATQRDRTWRWRNCSVPQDAPIMTESEAGQAEIFEGRLRERLAEVHAVLFILRDEWLEEMGSLYHELVEATLSHHGTQVPIISVLPRGADAGSLNYRAPGVALVRWHARSIIRAVRRYALPVFPSEMRLTRLQTAERLRIIATLAANKGSINRTAAALGVGRQTLKRTLINYIIR
jgi:hypothetical protein